MLVLDVRAGKRILRGYHPKNRWRSPEAMFTSHSVGTLFRTNLHKRFGLYTLKYPIFGDSLFMKKIAIAPDTKVVAANFVVGEFCVDGGFSSANIARSICELWLMQRETGESPLVQYLLFQLRLLRHICRVTAR